MRRSLAAAGRGRPGARLLRPGDHPGHAQRRHGRVSKDDGPRAGTTVEKLAELKPVFRPDGKVTAGNACPLNDGAAAVVVMSDTKAGELGITPLARIVGSGRHRPQPGDHGHGPRRGLPPGARRGPA